MGTPECPRLPLASIRPFHFSAGGNHSSNLMLDAGSDLAMPTTRQNGTGTLVVLPRPSFDDSNKPVSSVAETIVALGGAMLDKSPQLVAIAGTAEAIEPTAESASRTQRGDIRCIVSPPLFVGQNSLTAIANPGQMLASWLT